METSDDERYSNDDPESDENVEDEEEEEVEPPKPVVPTHQWECEHCTYVNRAGTRVCAICCKTPTAVPKVAKQVPPSTGDRRRRLRRTNTDPCDVSEMSAASTRMKKASDANESRQRRHSEFAPQRSTKREEFDESPYEGVNISKFNKQLRVSPQKSIKAYEDDPYETIQTQMSDVESNASKKKGRPFRKISFWPGTKFYQ